VYSARNEKGERLRFGSSGLLYRSNKLMFDRGSRTLWHNLTGDAVLGTHAAVGAKLTAIPVTVTTWGAWRSAHPETTVVWLSAGFGERWGFDYLPGAADRHRAGVRFPVWQKSTRLDGSAEILGVRIGGAAKAYPVESVAVVGIANDTLAGVPLAVIADPATGALRAYRRNAHELRRAADGTLVDAAGRRWRETEAALLPPPGDPEPPLERLAAHLSFWFGWFGFFPETELYEHPRAPSG